MNRFESTNEQARNTELGRALPVRLVRDEDKGDARTLCGHLRCGAELPRLKGPVLGLALMDVKRWHDDNGIWEIGGRRQPRRHVPRGVPLGPLGTVGGILLIQLPAYFRCPRKREHLSVLLISDIWTIVRI